MSGPDQNREDQPTVFPAVQGQLFFTPEMPREEPLPIRWAPRESRQIELQLD